MKIRRVGVELFHADRRTEGHDEANSHFFAILQTRLKTTSKLQIVILSSFIKTM